MGTGRRVDPLSQGLPEQPRLALAQPAHGFGVLRVLLRSFGKLYAARREKGANAVVAGSPVDVGKIVAADVERLKVGSLALGTPVQEIVEHLFPGRGVHARRVSEHAVEVENRGVEVAPADDDCRLLGHFFSFGLHARAHATPAPA